MRAEAKRWHLETGGHLASNRVRIGLRVGKFREHHATARSNVEPGVMPPEFRQIHGLPRRTERGYGRMGNRLSHLAL